MNQQLIFCLIFVFGFHESTQSDDHPDTYLSTEELVQKYGYPLESYELTTEDGYILTIHRIRHGKNDQVTNSKPILMMHGLFGQCENYIINGMNNGSLAYLFADNGYDVWLGNSRGTLHGRKHKDLYPDNIEFWNFSWHEIGMHDLPAIIDFILSKTKKMKLHYIGHSQGGTAFYIMTSMKPEYQAKLGLASLLGPAGFMKHFKSPLVWPFVLIEKELTALAKLMNVCELPPPPINLGQLLLKLCKNTAFQMRNICELSYHIGLGGDSGLFRQEMLPLLTRFIPSVSVRQPLHFSQVVNSGHFRPWDYGEEKNNEVYGQSVPPDYPIEKILTPIAIYYGSNDIMTAAEQQLPPLLRHLRSTVINCHETKLMWVDFTDNVFNRRLKTAEKNEDIEELCEILTNCVRRYLIPHPKWTHLDFLTATTAHSLLNIPLLEFLQQYDSLLNEM